ncbi:PhoU domain-containing protein [Nanoarchaeota archaeon]
MHYFVYMLFGGIYMEYRKLISFGKSSYVVSIPKNWVFENKLKKGDLIRLDQEYGNLVLQPKINENDQPSEPKEILINVEGKSVKQLYREIIPAYIDGFESIVLKGKDIKEKAEPIKELIRGLIALETMEQTGDRIVAKDFLNMKEISITSLIRKMDIIVRSMMVDTKKSFEEDNFDNIYSRDGDINRLTYLIFRAIKYGLKNPLVAKKLFDLEPWNLLGLWRLTANIEHIGDTVKRVAKIMREIQLSKAKQKEFVQILAQVESTYLNMMKSYHNQDVNLAYEMSTEKEPAIRKLDDFYLENKSAKKIGFLVNHLKQTTLTVQDIGRCIYF